MDSRTRVANAMRRKSVDIPAVQYYYTDVGVYEHGEKLNDLLAGHPGDFAPFTRIQPPEPPPGDFGPDGRYYVLKRDAWGTLWEYRIFGRMGHAVEFPIPTVRAYETYEFPALPAYCTDSAVFEQAKQNLADTKARYFTLRGEGYAFLERLIALRGFENAMMDLLEDGAEVNAFLDRLADYYYQSVVKLVEMGADCICFGDDYGTQQNLLFSPALFRKSLAPRFKRLTDPIREAGLVVHFHSCGQIAALFPVFEEIGVTSIWPQLPAYDMSELAAACDRHGFSLAIHTDRARTMTSGTPDQVREMVRREFEIFKPLEGKSWFYMEVDHGFPYENIAALVESVYALRRNRL